MKNISKKYYFYRRFIFTAILYSPFSYAAYMLKQSPAESVQLDPSDIRVWIDGEWTENDTPSLNLREQNPEKLFVLSKSKISLSEGLLRAVYAYRNYEIQTDEDLFNDQLIHKRASQILDRMEATHVKLNFDLRDRTTQNGILHYAAAKKLTFVVKRLLVLAAKKGIPLTIDAENKAGETPLAVALATMHQDAKGTDSRDIVNALIEHGAQVNHINKNGESLLHVGVKTGKISLIKNLMATPGINPTIQNSSKETPYQTAQRLNNSAALALLPPPESLSRAAHPKADDKYKVDSEDDEIEDICAYLKRIGLQSHQDSLIVLPDNISRLIQQLGFLQSKDPRIFNDQAEQLYGRLMQAKRWLINRKEHYKAKIPGLFGPSIPKDDEKMYKREIENTKKCSERVEFTLETLKKNFGIGNTCCGSFM